MLVAFCQRCNLYAFQKERTSAIMVRYYRGAHAKASANGKLDVRNARVPGSSRCGSILKFWGTLGGA